MCYIKKVMKKGQMTKKGHLRHTWKMRWFVLTTTDLFYYESKESLVKKVILLLSVFIYSKLTTICTYVCRRCV